MSTINSKNVQVGTSGVANQNFTLYQPNTPDGTVRLGVGNSGATTSDVVTVTNAGNMTVSGVVTATTLSGAITGGAVTATSLAVSGATTTTSLAVNSNNISAVNSLGFRNRVINGNMAIDQRNAGASITPTNGQFSVDRWLCGLTQASKFSVQQSTTAPTGYGFSLLATSLSAYSVASGDAFLLQQKIEGFNFADMAWGTASAQTVTLSFQVRSSLTGTFGGSVQNSAQNRTYPFSYTISAANTWETKTVTIAGDTTGTWIGATNGVGLLLNFGLGCGSTFSGTAGSWAAANYFTSTGATSVVGTNGATFYITGVQLEAGSVASPFERLDYGRQLIQCQRYLPAFPVTSTNWRLPAVGLAAAGNTVFLTLTLPTTTRVPPTGMTVSSASHWVVGVDGLVGSVAFSTFSFSSLASTNAARITGTTATGPFSTGQVVTVDSTNASANLYFTGCEL